MQSTPLRRRSALGLALAALVLTIPAAAQSAEESYFKAYYLQHEKGDLKSALELYEKLARNRRTPAELRAKARSMARAVAEELACSDFAQLMPADSIFYMEFNRPGDQLRRLLGQLGLLRDDGAGADAFGISPLLVDGLLGMRGMAVAVTGIDPRRGPNNGVVVMHPGDLDVVRGIMETALPFSGRSAEPIGNHPTWHVENEAWVTLTSRLLIASPDRAQIEAVVARLQGKGGNSLADNKRLANALGMRGDDMLFFCVNLEPVMPMIMDAVQRETRRDPGAQAALALLDLGSTRCLAGRAGVDEDGLSFDMALELDEKHRNLLFNLFRMPNIHKDTLAMVPAGSAFFGVFSMNNRGDVPPGAKDAGGKPVVTIMDFGREFFANVTDVAFYAMPQVQPTKWGPMPEMALALRVNDPERSRALWDFLLGTAQLATGGKATVSNRSSKTRIDRYEIQGVPVFLATRDHDLILSPSEAAIMSSLEARKNGKTVLKDAVYAASLSSFNKGSIEGYALNIGRCTELASHYMSARDRREMQPWAGMMQDTTMSCTTQQTANRLQISGRITGIPNIGPMVKEQIAREMHGGRRQIGSASAAPTRGQPVGAEQLQAIFEQLHADDRFDDARKVATAFQQQAKGEPMQLNDFAWALLTEERFGNRYDGLALKIARTANEGSEWSNWYYLDTYATALFQQGKIDEAIEFERKAIKAGSEDPRINEAQATLQRFLDAKAAQKKKNKKKLSGRQIQKP